MSPLGEHERAAIREVFAALERDVPIVLELGPEEAPVTVLAGGREIEFGDETRLLLEQLTELSGRIELTVTETESPGRWPKTTVADLRRDMAVVQQQVAELTKRADEWDRRLWGLVAVAVGAALSLAAGLIVTLLKSQ